MTISEALKKDETISAVADIFAWAAKKGTPQKKIAEQSGCSQATVSRLIRFHYGACAEVKLALDTGVIGLDAALEIARAPYAQQEFLLVHATTARAQRLRPVTAVRHLRATLDEFRPRTDPVADKAA